MQPRTAFRVVKTKLLHVFVKETFCSVFDSLLANTSFQVVPNFSSAG
jgi:hypothetical protein